MSKFHRGVLDAFAADEGSSLSAFQHQHLFSAKFAAMPASAARGFDASSASTLTVPAIVSTFSEGVLSSLGNEQANAIVFSRNAAGTILVNNGTVPVTGGTPTVANTTLMQSDITTGSDVLTNASRPMVGQAEYVVNSGLTYSGPSGVNATALYNVVGSRILEAGARPFPDSYEQARHIVDLSVQVPVFNNTSIRLDGKNLLDSPYEVIQGGITRVRYRAGRVFAFGASWSP